MEKTQEKQYNDTNEKNLEVVEKDIRKDKNRMLVKKIEIIIFILAGIGLLLGILGLIIDVELLLNIAIIIFGIGFIFFLFVAATLFFIKI